MTKPCTECKVFHGDVTRLALLTQRGGELHCELKGDRVHIGGRVVPYLKGEITV